jgi:Uma2 family endonuclease
VTDAEGGITTAAVAPGGEPALPHAALHPRQWTAAEYHRLAEVGVLHEDDRVELIDGAIVEMSPIGARHAARVNAIAHLLRERAGRRCLVSAQNPIRLSERSEPQPDVTLLRWRDDFYRGELPPPAEVLLVIEVADSSLLADRSVKLPLYGRAGIREAWLVDLAGGVIEEHAAPSSEGYDRRRLHRSGEISVAAIPELAVSVAEVLGER